MPKKRKTLAKGFVSPKARQVNPPLARAMDRRIVRSARANLDAAVEKFRTRRATAHKDNRFMKAQLKKLWFVELLPRLKKDPFIRTDLKFAVTEKPLPKLSRASRKAMPGLAAIDSAIKGGSSRNVLVRRAKEILERNPRLLDAYGSFWSARTNRKLAEQVVDAWIAQRQDWIHDSQFLASERQSLKRAGQHYLADLKQAHRNTRKLGATLKAIHKGLALRKNHPKRKELMEVIECITNEANIKFAKGGFYSGLVNGDIHNRWKFRLPADFRPVFARVLSQMPKKLYVKEYQKFLKQLFSEALKFYHVPNENAKKALNAFLRAYPISRSKRK